MGKVAKREILAGSNELYIFIESQHISGWKGPVRISKSNSLMSNLNLPWCSFIPLPRPAAAGHQRGEISTFPSSASYTRWGRCRLLGGPPQASDCWLFWSLERKLTCFQQISPLTRGYEAWWSLDFLLLALVINWLLMLKKKKIKRGKKFLCVEVEVVSNGKK